MGLDIYPVLELKPLAIKGYLSPKTRAAQGMIELLLKNLLVYYSPIFDALKVPERPVGVSYDDTPH